MDKKEKMFEEQQNWYKGNLHAHTINSDGRLTPEQCILIYKQHGYAFMCLSDHDYYTDLREQFDGKDFILLPGLEGSVRLLDSSVLDIDVNELTEGKGYVDMYPDEIRERLRKKGNYRLIKTHHIHGILGNKAMQEAAGERCFNENEVIPVRIYFDQWNGVEAANEYSEYLKSRGCFTTYNHPIWSRVELEDVKDIKGFWAMEVYNYATVNECGEGEDTVFWDSILRRGGDIMAFAGDDNHNEGKYPECFGGYVMVQAEELSHESIVNSLLEGRYYSSSGAEISQWGIKDNKVYVDCPQGKRINFIFGGRVGSSRSVVAANDLPLTHVECPMQGHETYVRIEVIDMNGKKAWTNPIKLK